MTCHVIQKDLESMGLKLDLNLKLRLESVTMN